MELKIPDGSNKLLMHCCCAPCSGGILERLLANKIEVVIFFYNPNIHPKKEYEIRKEEIIKFANKLGVKVIDADYDVQNWFEYIQGLEKEPERGKRCIKCFDMRLIRTALYAYERGYKYFSTSLSISRWKDIEQVNIAGHKAASFYTGVSYWDYNWRKEGGTERMYKISKRENFYKQQYCGCIYSLLSKEKNNKKEIEINLEEKV